MASYKRFEDLPVWKEAIALAGDVFSLTARPAFKYRGDLVNQIRRAALSVSNNIAEGFERGTTADLINFLYIARGSCGESRSMMRFAATLEGMDEELGDIESVASRCEHVSRQLWGWIDSLKNSSLPGERRMTDATRTTSEIERMREEYREKFSAQAENAACAEGRKKHQEFIAAKMQALFDLKDAEATAGMKEGSEPCPICGQKMVKRHDKFGHPFWGCSAYPRCKGTRPWVTPKR